MGLQGVMLSPSAAVFGVSLLGSAISSPVGLLEPAVAGYALRLYRILGPRGGWWVCGSFSLLALGHLVQALGVTPKVVGTFLSFDLIAFLSPLLLLIGMVNTEKTYTERARAEQKEQKIRQESESKTKEKLASLARDREALQEQVAQFSKRERVLEDSSKQYYLLFGCNPQPMFVIDLSSQKILAVNNAAVAQFGWASQEFLTRTVGELVPAEQRAAFLEDMARPAPVGESRGTWLQRRKGGTAFQADISAVDLQYGDCPARLILATDTTERTQTEARLRQQEKMETIGRVAGMVGEHFDNLIQTIATQTETLLQRHQELDNERALKQLSTTANQAAVITQQLLTVGGRRFVATEALDLNHFLSGLEAQIVSLLGTDVRLQTTYRPDLPFMLGDPLLLEQVVVNLIQNARNAMASGCVVSVETSWVEIKETGPNVSGPRAGEYVCLTVHDTGCGLSSDAQARLFEPFCTTPAAGTGLGLGLASVYGAVKQLAGWTELATSTGSGTEVMLYFPACESRPLPPAPVAEPEPEPVVSGKILLVEPNDQMRQMARSVLEWKGYKVIETDSASLALTVWPSHGQGTDLLLVDTALPGHISGRELAHRLREARPELKVIFTCDSEAKTRVGDIDMQNQSLRKPFSSVELLERVSDCLATRS